MDSRKKPDIFVISSQVPLKNLGESMDSRQGKSGQIVQRMTGCDMLVMSEDPVSDEEAAMLKNNINPDSWVIITGHGQEGGGFDAIIAETDKFVIDTQFLFDETLPVEYKHYPVSRYVEMLTEQGNLVKGDHINLMLFVCHAAMENEKKSKKSFAEELGRALAEKGVTSCIIANESQFLRLKNPHVSEIKIQNKNGDKHFSLPEPPFVFMTNQKGETVKYQAPGDVTISRDGVRQENVSNIRKKYNESFMKGGKFHSNINTMYDRLDKAIQSRWHAQDYDNNKVTLNAFMTGKDDAGKALNELSLVKFRIGISESKPGYYRLSYFESGKVLHALFNNCETMVKYINNKKLWYRPPVNFGYVTFAEDPPTPPRTRIGFFDNRDDNARHGSQSGLDKGPDGVKGPGNDKKF